MTTLPPKPRAHLIERAAQTLGGVAGLRPGSARPVTTTVEPLPVTHQAPEPDPAPPAPPTHAPIADAELAHAGLVSTVAGRSRLSEEFAIVFNQLRSTARSPAHKSGQDPRVILVTSARPGEGKSFTSLNIAGGLAIAGNQPVLLVDADGKNGSLSDLLGLKDAAGLRNLATDPTQRVAPLIVPTMHACLSVLSYGPPHPTPTPSASLAPAVRALIAAFPRHIIIIDVPPCLSTSEASMLAPVVGQVLMVVEAEKTPKREVEAALDMVDACPVLNLILNQVKLATSSTFGAYGYGESGDAYYHAPTRT